LGLVGGSWGKLISNNPDGRPGLVGGSRRFYILACANFNT
jgi:hypothetical protein